MYVHHLVRHNQRTAALQADHLMRWVLPLGLYPTCVIGLIMMGTVDIPAGVVFLVLGTIVVVSAASRTLRAKLKQRELGIVRILAALEQCKPSDPSWEVLARQLFTLYDQDQSGRLTVDELKGLAERMFESLPRRTIAVFFREEALRPGQQHVTLSEFMEEFGGWADQLRQLAAVASPERSVKNRRVTTFTLFRADRVSDRDRTGDRDRIGDRVVGGEASCGAGAAHSRLAVELAASDEMREEMYRSRSLTDSQGCTPVGPVDSESREEQQNYFDCDAVQPEPRQPGALQLGSVQLASVPSSEGTRCIDQIPHDPNTATPTIGEKSGAADAEATTSVAGGRISAMPTVAVMRRGSAPGQLRRRRGNSVTAEDRPVAARRSLYAEVTDSELREALASVCGAADTVPTPRATGRAGSVPTSSIVAAISRVRPSAGVRSSARSSVKETQQPASTPSGSTDLAALEAAEESRGEVGGEGGREAEGGLRT